VSNDSPHRISACPFGNDCDWHYGYPDGYADPPWDGTTAGFRDVVLPARTAAIRKSLNDHLASHGFADLRFEWQSSPA
jgi:hypothetical protein